MREHEAQRRFLEASKTVKSPTALRVSAHDRTVVIGWQRRPGQVDGFLILQGEDPAIMSEVKSIPWSPAERFEETLPGLLNGRRYFVTVVAYKGDERSEMPEVWEVVPGILPQARRAERIDTTRTIAVSSGTALVQEVTPTTPENDSPPAPAIAQSALPSLPVAEMNPRAMAVCGHCSGDIVRDDTRHSYRCEGCATEYVKRADDRLIEIGRLQNGICECCSPRRPLIRLTGNDRLRCLGSQEEYVRSNDRLVRISQLDYGLCTCCTPQHPLMLLVQSQTVVCSVQRDHVYRRQTNGSWRYVLPPPPPNLVNDINRALANGGAVLLPGGIPSTGSPSRSSRRTR